MTSLRLNPLHWPLHVKAPLLVAVLTVLASMIISEVALSRLAQNQKIQLERLAGAYLDGLSNAILPQLVRRDIWEAFDALDRANAHYEGLKARYTIVALADGTVLAASDPVRFPVDTPVPATLVARLANGGMVIDEARARAWVRREITADDVPLGAIYAEIDLAEQIAERRSVLAMLVTVNSVLTLLFAVAGYLVVRYMLRPVSVLGTHIEHIRGGSPEPIAAAEIARQGPEFAALFRRFNAMVAAIDERELLAQRLAEEEKIALLGKLASGMAHEVNNPLGGMMTAVDTLRKHGADPRVRRTALDLLARGLAGIRNVVRAALVTYKGTADPSHLGRGDLDDLKFLVQHEIAHRHLRLDWRNGLPDTVAVDGAAMRQAALNLLLNACAASPEGGAVEVAARTAGGALLFSVTDRGPGLPASVAALYRARSSEDLPAPGTSGLGAWTAVRLVTGMGGRFEVETSPETGTRLTIVVPLAAEDGLDAVA